MPIPGANLPEWDAVFTETSRRRIGSGKKVTGAEEITWTGELAGRRMTAVSRVRLCNPMEGFLTPSNMRLRDSFHGRSGHWVDVRIAGPVSDAELDLVQAMASAADARLVQVTRGRHPPVPTWR